MVTIHVIVRGARAFVRRRARGETRRTLSTRAAGQIVASITLALGLAPGWVVARRVRRELWTRHTRPGTVHAIVRAARARRRARRRVRRRRRHARAAGEFVARIAVALGLAHGWVVARRVRRERWTRHTRPGTVHAIVRAARARRRARRRVRRRRRRARAV